MYLPAPSGNEFELAPAGTHLAVCYRVIDLGTQKSTYNGKEKEQHKILISWELADEMMTDGKPFIIGQRYTWSMSEKATLRKHLESWRGAAFQDKDFAGPPNGFNIRNILGKGCILTIAHKEEGDRTYANITGIGKLMKGMTSPMPTNTQMFLWLETGLWDMNTFNILGDGLKKIIMQAPEYVAITTGRPIAPESENPAPDDMNDEVPF